jgi:hypothetical protein
MLSRPTTEQILHDCRAELLDKIAPAVAPGAAQIAIDMLDNVLRNCAMRAAHEIAWMREEGGAMVAFAMRVAASSSTTPEVSDALRTYDAADTESLHLDDVVHAYGLAGACFGAALDAAMASGDEVLTRDARALLEERLAHENEIMGEWAMVGRA